MCALPLLVPVLPCRAPNPAALVAGTVGGNPRCPAAAGLPDDEDEETGGGDKPALPSLTDLPTTPAFKAARMLPFMSGGCAEADGPWPCRPRPSGCGDPYAPADPGIGLPARTDTGKWMARLAPGLPPGRIVAPVPGAP
jgi:hypothetical protein